MQHVMMSARPGGSVRPTLAARAVAGSASVVMCWVKMPMNDSP